MAEPNGLELAEQVLRTPDDRFAKLPGFPFQPHYIQQGNCRMHYLDEGPRDGPVILLLHGEPTWSYLYRHMVPVFSQAGFRVVAPDLIGFGRSDKPAERRAHSYASHVTSICTLVGNLNLEGITAFYQDWGGLIGLRVATALPQRFARLVVANTSLPDGPGGDGFIAGQKYTGSDPGCELRHGDGFSEWLRFSQVTPDLDMGYVVQWGTVSRLDEAVKAAYSAPFPSADYKSGPRVLPTLVASQNASNRAAWKILERWQKPVLTLFSDSDPILGSAFGPFQDRIPGAAGQPHITVSDAGHFLQEDKGAEIADYMIRWIRGTSD